MIADMFKAVVMAIREDEADDIRLDPRHKLGVRCQ